MTNLLLQRPGKLALCFGLLLPFLAGCTTSQAVEPPPYRGAATQASFSEAQLDSLLAPVALYPDTVLSHVLIASTYPLEVVEADRWARNNTRYQGDEAVNAVDGKDWDPSVKALVAFPDILKRMSDDLDWTQQLGDAFLANEAQVMDSVQKLRNRAYDSGSLDKVEHVRVIREERTIVIEPSVERVVYVPAYDTRVVYGNWWWPDYPPVYWHHPSSYVFVSGFYWGPRVYLGPRFYFSGVHWHQRRVVVIDHHHSHRFYDSRSVVRYNNARHWHHNPVHRRGVAYYDNHTRERFNSPRESYRDARVYRTNLRDNPQGNQRDYVRENVRGNIHDNNRRDASQLAPNRARDQRQDRDSQFQQQLERRQAGPLGGNDARARIYGENKGNQERAQQLRERMNSRTEVQSGRGIQINTPQGERPVYSGEERRENRIEQPVNRSQPINRTQQPAHQQSNRPAQTVPGNRIERPQTPRSQPVERSQPRFQNTERPTPRVDRGNSGGGDNRASMRGERTR